MTSPKHDELLTIKAAALRVGRAESTIRRWRREGLIEFYGGRVRGSDLLRAEQRARERDPSSRQTPLIALARELGIEPDVLRQELRALVMDRR